MSIRGTAGAAPRELRDEMPETIAHTTVMTILARSHERRLLAREHEGRGYRYYPTKSRDGFVSEHTSTHWRGRVAVGSTMSRAVPFLRERVLSCRSCTVLDRPRKLRDGSGGRLGRVKDVIGGRPPAAAGVTLPS
jgi:hypothetical protein